MPITAESPGLSHLGGTMLPVIMIIPAFNSCPRVARALASQARGSRDGP